MYAWPSIIFAASITLSRSAVISSFSLNGATSVTSLYTNYITICARAACAESNPEYKQECQLRLRSEILNPGTPVLARPRPRRARARAIMRSSSQAPESSETSETRQLLCRKNFGYRYTQKFTPPAPLVQLTSPLPHGSKRVPRTGESRSLAQWCQNSTGRERNLTPGIPLLPASHVVGVT